MIRYILQKFGYRIIEEKTYKAIGRSLVYCYSDISFDYKGLTTFEKSIISIEEFKELVKVAKDVN
jgi:hypothetical protein